MKILIQCPEGLKQKAIEISKKYEAEGHQVYLSASPCYGACDLALDEARWLQADKLVHVGHNEFLSPHSTARPGIEVEYIPYHVDINVENLKGVLPYLEKGKTVGLVTTVQHIHQYDQMKEFFEKKEIKVLTGKGTRMRTSGQLLGCDGGAVGRIEKKVDYVVFVGNGLFHPTAIEDPNKPVYCVNPTSGQVKEIKVEIEKLRKQRRGAIAFALTAKQFGILLSTKPGQFAIAQANWAKEELKKRGYNAAILIANEITPMAVNNFMSFDCLINTACPRLGDDNEMFEKPILNAGMLKELFGLIDNSKKN